MQTTHKCVESIEEIPKLNVRHMHEHIVECTPIQYGKDVFQTTTT